MTTGINKLIAPYMCALVVIVQMLKQEKIDNGDWLYMV